MIKRGETRWRAMKIRRNAVCTRSIVDRGHQFWRIAMKHLSGFLFAFLLAVSLPQSVATQTMGQPEHLSAGAIDINNGRAGQIQINVDRWSTAADRATLVEAL